MEQIQKFHSLRNTPTKPNVNLTLIGTEKVLKQVPVMLPTKFIFSNNNPVVK